MVEREKHHYDTLRRRISNFVGHSAYKEKLLSDRKLGTTDDEDSSGDEAKFGNFATNYLKGKKQLAEGSHDRMYNRVATCQGKTKFSPGQGILKKCQGILAI